MKHQKLIPALIIVVLVASTGMTFAQTEILTFDDLPSSNGLIADGYGGLQWRNFYLLDGIDNSLNPSGYQNGVVSPDNVVFNAGGSPAQFSGALFNFNSAYFTGAWNDELQLEVQGFVSGTLIYDNTYTVDATGSTLLTFDYLGVDEVNFISSGGVNHGYGGSGTQFVMDNLSITIDPVDPGLVTFVPEPPMFALGALAVAVAISRYLTAQWRELLARLVQNARQA